MLVSYDQSSQADEWIPFEADRLAPFGKKVGVKQHSYGKGMLVDVRDVPGDSLTQQDSHSHSHSRWFTATVVARRP